MERVRHRFGLLLSMMALALMTCACFDLTPLELSREDDVAMVVDISMPDDSPRTKSIVPGTENPVSVMQLVCFDASGLYLGIRTVDDTANDYGELVTSGGVNSTTMTQTGRIIARVPAGTARIHFIANRNLGTPLDFTAGTSERIVMRSLTTPADHNQIVYWGYHFEKTAEAMLAWMQVAVEEDPNTHFITAKAGATPNKVYLIRDRARIQLTFASGLVGSGATHSKVEWLIHNGRDAGLVAPYNSAQNLDTLAVPPVNHWTGYTDAGGTQATTPMTEYTASGRYSLWNSAADEGRTFDSSDSYQYVFEDSNKKVGDDDGRIKLILKVYTNNTTFKYLVILLEHNDEQIEIRRNGTYVIKINSLDARGYSTLEAAVNGEEFANAPVESPREMTTVANEDYILQIALDQTPETAGNTTTSAVYSTTGEKIIPFKFLDATTNQPITTGLSASDFEVKWENSTYATWTPSNSDFTSSLANYLSYNSSTKCWEVRVTLGAIGATDPYRDYLIIKHKDSGMTRFVHIYGIHNFAFGTEPTFEKVNATYSETVNGETKTFDIYKLSFRLPDTYDESLYPLDIRMATSTLEPYSDNGYTSRQGMFGVEIASTASLTPTSTTASDWNYKASSWGYWYVYSLPSMPHLGESNQGEVELYFLDITSSKGQTNPTSVGLFLEIPDFGGLRYYYLTR